MEKLFSNYNLTQVNLTGKYLLALSKTRKSIDFLDTARKINIFSTIILVTIGLVGHLLTLYVYSQKRFRINSGNIYLACLAVVDGLFLIVHLFESTIRTIKDAYSHNANINLMISLLNIVDQNNFTCCLINYSRNVLRFMSAYMIVAFTMQRLVIVYKPLLNKFKSKNSAWLTCLIILFISLAANMWAPFMFELKRDEVSPYCDVNREWTREYFILNACYMFVVMLLPIVVIFICNLFIICKTCRDDAKRNKLKHTKPHQLIQVYKRKRNAKPCINDLRMLRVDKKTKRIQKMNSFNQVYSKKMTKTLMLVSFSYAVLNLPYVIVWCVYFIFTTVVNIEWSTRNELFSLVQITEIFNILNYCIHFYIYCLSGSLFRDQLKDSFSRDNKRLSMKRINSN